MRSCCGRGRAAFAQRFSHYNPLLHAVCRRYLGASPGIEDIVQETALQALLNLNTLRQPARFGPWLAGIGLNLCRRWQRDRRSAPWSWEAMHGGMYRREPIDHHGGPADIIASAELQSCVLDAVATLPEGRRSAVLLFYLSGLTYAETAALLGIPVGAVRTRLHKARAALRNRLWRIWQEEQMTSEPSGTLRPMRVIDIRVHPEDESGRNIYASAHVLVLQETDGGRTLPIWVDPREGVNIALLLEHTETPRPLTSAFMAGLLEAAGARIEHVLITRLERDIYYAEAVIAGPAGRRTVDARPSDALLLALTTGAAVYADATVLELAASVPIDLRPGEQHPHACVREPPRTRRHPRRTERRAWPTPQWFRESGRSRGDQAPGPRLAAERRESPAGRPAGESGRQPLFSDPARRIGRTAPESQEARRCCERKRTRP